MKNIVERIMVSWKGIYFILTLFCGSFFGSIFMLGPFLPLMFVSPSWYRWINSRLVATWLTLPVALLETMFGVKVIITGDAFVPGERSVIIMNHRTRMDWLFLWNCLMRYSYLRLEKICLKASLKSVPGFGWAMQAAAYIFIHRKWKDDQSHFEDIIDYFCDIREPLQLLIFPEGTDLTENSKARSNDFAEKNGLQKYEYVLHPRTTGFTFVVERLREAPDQQHQSPSEAEETHGQYFHPAGAVHLLLFLSYNGDPGQSRRKREATKTVELFANLSALLLPSTSLKSRCFTYPFGVNAFCLITTHFCSTVTFTQQLKRALP
ncbi:lysocardiolipin acyltransferase 1 isoform X6 [Ailuropoda melanoleuca]|uniref:lysocardiolipin acyltransferase 1 isoform X6 n=1 Tax=Ailuropoda melanoleuca TaxID=9646 RepID=UPI001494FC58|nr:lysocardiolipin acyltransferase 1 isoform X6 [Ailuropoda melanoleuca]